MRDSYPTAVKLSLTLGIGALILLVPYFLSVLDKLNPARLILTLKKEAAAKLRVNLEVKPPAAIDIRNVSYSALAFKDYDTFSKGVEALAVLMFEGLGKQPTGYEGSIFKFIALNKRVEPFRIRLLDMFPSEIEHGRAAMIMVDAIHDLAARSFQTEPEHSLYVAIDLLEDFAIEAIDKSLDQVASHATDALGRLGEDAIENGRDFAPWCIVPRLVTIGERAAETGAKSSTRHALFRLAWIAIKAVRKDWNLPISALGFGVRYSRIVGPAGGMTRTLPREDSWSGLRTSSLTSAQLL